MVTVKERLENILMARGWYEGNVDGALEEAEKQATIALETISEAAQQYDGTAGRLIAEERERIGGDGTD